MINKYLDIYFDLEDDNLFFLISLPLPLPAIQQSDNIYRPKLLLTEDDTGLFILDNSSLALTNVVDPFSPVLSAPALLGKRLTYRQLLSLLLLNREEDILFPLFG